MFKNKYVLLVLFLVLSIYCKAQYRELRAIANTKLQFANNWKASIDGGVYKGLCQRDWNRYGIRFIGQKKINSVFQYDFGFMFNYSKNTTSGSVKQEYRPNQTLKVTYPYLPKMAINHRFRLEEQIVHRVGSDTKISSRLRYELKTKRAFNPNELIDNKIPYYILSGELTFNFAGYSSGDYHLLERVRYGIGAGYKINSNTSIEGTTYFQHTQKLLRAKRSSLMIFNFCVIQNIFIK